MNPFLIAVGLGALAWLPQDDLESLRSEVADLPETERAILIEQIDAAAADQALLGVLGGTASTFEEEANKAGDDLAIIQAELASEDPPLPAPVEESTVADFESRERRARADFDEAKSRVLELEQEAARREERRREIPAELAKLATEAQSLDDDLGSAAPSELAGRVQRAAQQARRDTIGAEIDALQAELGSYDARRELLPLRLDRWRRRVRLRERDLGEWVRLHAAAREEAALDAQRRATALAREAAAQHEAISEVIRETQQYIERNQTAAIDLKDARADRLRAEKLLEDLEVRASNLRRKLSLVGLSDAMGRLFREQYQSLPPARELRATRGELRSDHALAEFDLIDLREKREALIDKETRVAELVARVDSEGPAPDAGALRLVAREAVEEHVRHYQELVPLVSQLVEERVQHLRSHEALVDRVNEHRRFLEENILYVRSVEGARLPSPTEALAGLRWLSVEANWGDSLPRSFRELASRTRNFSALLLGLALLVGRRRIRGALNRSGENARRYKSDQLGHTARAVLLTICIAAPVPLLMAALGLGLAGPEDQPAPAAGLGDGLVSTAWILAPLFFLRALCRSGGLGSAHLKWPAAACEAMRKELRWFLPAVAPLVLLGVAFREEEVAAFDDSLGRPAIWVALILLAVAIRRLLRPGGPLLKDWFRRSDGLLARTQGFWSFLAVTMPIALVGVSALGYHYTALEFAAAFRRTLSLAIGLVVARGLLSRWQVFVRRRLAVEQAKARSRIQARALQAESGAPSPAIDEDGVDIPSVDAQTKRLLGSLIAVGLAVGLYFIWAGVLPALSILDRVQVWPSVELLSAEAQIEADSIPTPAETEATGALERPLPGPIPTLPEPGEIPSGSVSLADVLLAAAFLLGTLVLAKNIPGLLEFAVLVRLPLDAGARYAITTLVRYVIVLTGMTAGMGAIGIGWSTVQWLAAALTFGLAFGLQEIFANFVSGIILLIERPLRVGDFVTVDGVEGQVTRLRMRATTITDWDNRELLVPNKQFITASLVNWTLSDPVTRIVVPVGVAYGSDVRLAESILIRVAGETANVLSDPSPSVVFREFGDSSLQLNLRVYVPHRDNWPQVVHALHLAIDDSFREAGIEIAFPQRDLHVRSFTPEAAKHMRSNPEES